MYNQLPNIRDVTKLAYTDAKSCKFIAIVSLAIVSSKIIKTFSHSKLDVFYIIIAL